MGVTWPKFIEPPIRFQQTVFKSTTPFEFGRVEQAQAEQAAAEATGMPELTAGQQTALRDAAADIEVREPVCWISSC